MGVSAIPASSTINNVSAPINSSTAAWLWWRSWAIFASVAEAPTCSPNTPAATAEGARPSTVPPLSRHAPANTASYASTATLTYRDSHGKLQKISYLRPTTSANQN